MSRDTRPRQGETFDAGDVVEERNGVESMQSALTVALVLRDGIPAKVLQKYTEGRVREGRGVYL